MTSRTRRRPPGATTAAGYGYRHKTLSRQLRAAMRDGTPCARCGQPMYRWQRIQLGHVDGDKTRYNGLEHARCNEAAGAAWGNRRRGPQPPQPWRSARQW